VVGLLLASFMMLFSKITRGYGAGLYALWSRLGTPRRWRDGGNAREYSSEDIQKPEWIN